MLYATQMHLSTKVSFLPFQLLSITPDCFYLLLLLYFFSCALKLSGLQCILLIYYAIVCLLSPDTNALKDFGLF